MKKIEIEIPEGKKAEWVNNVLTLVDDKPKDITERIKTFDDTKEYLCSTDTPRGTHSICAYNAFVSHGLDKYDKQTIAFLKLRIIAAALNEGEDVMEEYGGGYIPQFIQVENGVKYESCWLAYDDMDAIPASLLVKSEELAEYFGKQFIDIWKDYLMG